MGGGPPRGTPSLKRLGPRLPRALRSPERWADPPDLVRLSDMLALVSISAVASAAAAAGARANPEGRRKPKRSNYPLCLEEAEVTQDGRAAVFRSPFVDLHVWRQQGRGQRHAGVIRARRTRKRRGSGGIIGAARGRERRAGARVSAVSVLPRAGLGLAPVGTGAAVDR